MLLVANAVQPAMTGPDNSFLGGLIIIATLLAANSGVSWLRMRVPFLSEAFESRPTAIAENGKWFSAVMDREGVDLQEVEGATGARPGECGGRQARGTGSPTAASAWCPGSQEARRGIVGR